jgi:predicted neuraminidase
MKQVLTLACLLSLGCGVAAAQHGRDLSRNIEIHRAFGSEHPGVYKHPASITELDNGDLYIAYYGGAGEYDDDTAVYGSRLKKGETQWSYPQVIADSPGIGEGNPVVWQAPDGIVFLWYNNRYGPTWSHARVLYKMSKDNAKTWSDPVILGWEEGSMVRGAPIVLNDGDYLLPMYLERGADTEFVAADTTSYFFRYNPNDKTWTESSRIKSATGNLQAEPVQISDDYLVAYIRRAGGYEPTETGYLLRAESRDGGHTWSEAVDTEFPNPNAAVAFIRLQNGHLLLAYNNHMYQRTPLTVAISTDNDESYPHRRDIIGGDNTYAYPYAIQARDGKIHLIFTTNGRTTIMHAVFGEEAILGRRGG